MLNKLIETTTRELADPRNGSRKERFTKARIIFTGLARAFGYSCSEIGEAIGKGRTTIYHYERSCNEKNLGKEYELYLKLRNEI